MPLKIEETNVSGAFLIRTSPFKDERGTFERVFCAREFSLFGLDSVFVQANVSRNKFKGTLRGLHAQREPHGEVKLVSCHSGSIFDVVVDVRPNSPSFKKWFGVELNPQNGLMLYIPKGCAHGYLTLSSDASVGYLVSSFYEPLYELGFHFADPAFGIDWPADIVSVSEKDANWPHLQ